MWLHLYFGSLSFMHTHTKPPEHHYYIDFIVINTLIHNLSGIFKRSNISLGFHTGIKHWKTRNVQLAIEWCPSPSAPWSHSIQRASDLHSKTPALTTDAHSRVKCLGMFSAGHNGKLLKLQVRILLKEPINFHRFPTTCVLTCLFWGSL